MNILVHSCKEIPTKFHTMDLLIIRYKLHFRSSNFQNKTKPVDMTSVSSIVMIITDAKLQRKNVFLSVFVCTELKIQAMMLSPNGLLNPKASMPLPPPPPLPVITHTAATPTIYSGQSRRPSATSTDMNSIEQRSPVSLRHTHLPTAYYIIPLTISDKVDLQKHSECKLCSAETWRRRHDMDCCSFQPSLRCVNWWAHFCQCLCSLYYGLFWLAAYFSLLKMNNCALDSESNIVSNFSMHTRALWSVALASQFW